MIGINLAEQAARASPSMHNCGVEGELVGVRLCRLCASHSGRLPGLRFHDHGARAAVLIDLALWRRIRRAATGEWIISTTPSGTPPADKMLAHLERYPESTTRDLLAKGPGRMAHFVDARGPSPRRQLRRPRIDQHETAAERQRLERAAAGDIDAPQTAALAMLADALRLIELTDPEGVLGQCGEAAWMVKECVDYLILLRLRYDLANAVGSIGSGS